MSDRARILVVDDREANRYILRRVLERAGYQCEQASTGRAALESVRSLPDLAILDVNLPDLSGSDVCRQIKNDPVTAQVAILQISASFVSSDDKAKALDAGADGYLTHPIDPVVLMATVQALLRLRKLEVSSREAATQWQAPFDSLQEGLALVDAEGKLTRMNRAFVGMCNHGGSCALGDVASDVLRRTFGTAEPFRQSGSGRHSAEFQIGGQTVQLCVDSLSVEGAPGGAEFSVLSDVTDRKLADYALRTAEQLAAAGKLAQALAHEINNPLEAVMNLLYLAETAASQGDVKTYLASAVDQLDRVGRITKQALPFHRDSAQPTAVDGAEILTEVVNLYAELAACREVKIVFEQRPAARIRGFPGQLRQVFGNLIRNAVEASPPLREVTVRVRAAHRSGRCGTRVTIHDRGAGISRSIRHKLFDPFFTTKELKGSGLGLRVSKTIVSSHGGTLRFRSRIQRGSSGTSFEVFLPGGNSECAPAGASTSD